GDLLVLDERRETDDQFAKGLHRADTLERRETVERYSIRLELFDGALNGKEPILEARDFRIIAEYAQPAFALHALEIHTPSVGIAEELLAALLEREKKTSLAHGRSAVQELRHRERLPGPGCTGDEDHRIAEESAAAHLVQLAAARRDANIRRMLLELNRRQRNDDEPSVGYDGE